MSKGKNPLLFLYFCANIRGEISMKVIIECPKNILENELLKDFQISKFETFELTDGTVCYITDINVIYTINLIENII